MYALSDEARNSLRPASPWRLRAMARQLVRLDASRRVSPEDSLAVNDADNRAWLRLSDRDRQQLASIVTREAIRA